MPVISMIANNCNLQFASNKKSPSFISLINFKHHNFKKSICKLSIQEKNKTKNYIIILPHLSNKYPKIILLAY